MNFLRYICLFFCLATVLVSPAQKPVYKLNSSSFFDNTEFGYSKVQMPQTMAGTHLAPEIGLEWKDNHRFYAGFDAMHEWGSTKIVDFFNPVVYYEFTGKPFRFYVGAFPRNLALDSYPRMFFQDSVLNYRPLINGIFWEYCLKNNYINAWLDWTSRQAPDRHEAFFMGWSMRLNHSVFYAQHFGYMHHFAGTMNPVPEDGGLHDNGLILTSLGVDLAKKTGFDKLDANIGWSVGLERERNRNDGWYTPQGFVSEIRLEYRGLGLFNTYYKGGSQQVFYNDHGNELYWGDPIYRSREYNRLDLYINFLKTDVVNVKMVYGLHFTEQTMYHEQMLKVSFSFCKPKKQGKRYEYIWDKWLKKYR